MSEQALQALNYLVKHGPSRLGTDASVLGRLANGGLISLVDPLTKTYTVTMYGRGVLREINKAGTEAMLNRMEAYLQ